MVSGEQSLDTEIFVGIRPVDALAVAEQLPLPPGGSVRVEESREPD